MAEEYNIPWRIEGDYVITGNGKYHKSDIQAIVNQRDHEVNNLRAINDILTSGVLIGEENAPKPVINQRQSSVWVQRYLKNY